MIAAAASLKHNLYFFALLFNFLRLETAWISWIRIRREQKYEEAKCYFSRLATTASHMAKWWSFCGEFELRAVFLSISFPHRSLSPLVDIHKWSSERTGFHQSFNCMLTSGEEKRMRNTTRAAQNQLQFTSRGIYKRWSLSPLIVARLKVKLT